MIAFLRGRIQRSTDEMLVVESGGVGYEVHLPGFVREALRAAPRPADQIIELQISYHVSPNQPRPLLVGFLREIEQEFFERFITVDGLGPTKAMKAIIHPIERVADAIERKDVTFLRRLPGIGERTAEKIVATLHGKMAKYALLRPVLATPQDDAEVDFREEVLHVLMEQLGHKSGEARRMVEEALTRNPGISSAEGLFQEVYRVERGAPA